jgi:threonine dehydrogenase-like Zn-dependent dehydrogenase
VALRVSFAFAAVAANVQPGKRVAVVGDGAVGLPGVLSARQMGAERIIMSRHEDRRRLAPRIWGGGHRDRARLADVGVRKQLNVVRKGPLADLRLAPSRRARLS